MDRDEEPGQIQEVPSQEMDLDLALRLSLESQREEEEINRALQFSAQSSEPAGEDGSSSPYVTVEGIPEPRVIGANPRRQSATFEPRICDDCGEIKEEGQFGFEDCAYAEEWYCIDCWQSWQGKCVSFANRPTNSEQQPAVEAMAAAEAAAAAAPAAPASSEEAGSDQQQQQQQQGEPVQDPPMNSSEGTSTAVHDVPLCEAQDATHGEPSPRQAGDLQHAGMQDATRAEPQPTQAADTQCARMQQVHRRFQRWFQQQQARAGVSVFPTAARHDGQTYLSPVQVMLTSVNRAEVHETDDVSPELPQLPELDFDIDDLYEESQVAAAIASAVLSQFASVEPAVQAARSPVNHLGASSSATSVEPSGDQSVSDEQRHLEQAERQASIAASQQRQQLLEQQDKEYAESLRVDQEKQAARQREAEFEQQRQEMLKQQAERHMQHQLEEQNSRRQERRPQPRREEVNRRSQPSSAAGDRAAAPKEFKASAESSKIDCSEELLSEADRRARQREMRLRAAEERMLGPSWITSSLPNSGAPSLTGAAAAALSSSQQQCRQQQRSDATTQQDSAAPKQSNSGDSSAASGDKAKHVDCGTTEHQAATDQASASTQEDTSSHISDAAGNDEEADFAGHVPSFEEIMGELDKHLQVDLSHSGIAGCADGNTSSAAATAAADGVHLADTEAVAGAETHSFAAATAYDRPAAAKKYERPESLKDELMKQSVAELRCELAQRGLSTKGCIEKLDIVERLFAAMEAGEADVAASAESASAHVAHTAAGPAKADLSPEVQESEISDQDLQDLYSTDWSKLFSQDAAPFDAQHCDPCFETEQGAARYTVQAEEAKNGAKQDENQTDELMRLRAVLRRQEQELLNARRLEKELEQARALLLERDREVAVLHEQLLQPDGAGSTWIGSSTGVSEGSSTGSSTGSLQS